MSPAASDAARSHGSAAPRRGIAGAIKSAFRQAMKAIAERIGPSPQPSKRRRKGGETVGGFHLAANNILRPIFRLATRVYSTVFLQDSLFWLHLWDWNRPHDEHDISANSRPTDDYHSSFRL
jgi:hypothetical protein